MKPFEMENISSTDESLGSLFTRLISEQDNVDPENVTPEYILEQRETKIYPDRTFEQGSRYGGYDGIDLTFMTRREIEKLINDTN